jgi:hypothetical protein
MVVKHLNDGLLDLPSKSKHVLSRQLAREQFTWEDKLEDYIGPAQVLLTYTPNLKNFQAYYAGRNLPDLHILRSVEESEPFLTKEASEPSVQCHSIYQHSLSALKISRRTQFHKSTSIQNNGRRSLQLFSLRHLSLRFSSGNIDKSKIERLAAHPGLESLCLSGTYLNVGNFNLLDFKMPPNPSYITYFRLDDPPTLSVKVLEFLLRRLTNLKSLSINSSIRSLDMGGSTTGIINLHEHGTVLREYGQNLVLLDLSFKNFTNHQARRIGLGSLHALQSLQHLIISWEDLFNGEVPSIYGDESATIPEEAPHLRELLPQSLESLSFYDEYPSRRFTQRYDPISLSTRSYFQRLDQELQDLKEDPQFKNLKTCGVDIWNLREGDEAPTYRLFPHFIPSIPSLEDEKSPSMSCLPSPSFPPHSPGYSVTSPRYSGGSPESVT